MKHPQIPGPGRGKVELNGRKSEIWLVVTGLTTKTGRQKLGRMKIR